MEGIKKYKIIIKGVTPLRQHRRPLPGDHEMKSIGAKIPTKEQEKQLFENHRYWEKSIGYYQPSTQIKKALILAAHKWKVPGEGQAKFSKYVGSAIFIEPERLIHKVKTGFRAIGHWTTNKAGRVETQVWCVKPQIDKWELEFDITSTMPEKITDANLKEFIEYAGLYMGIGTDRPERGKGFGRFELKSFKIVK